MRAIGLLLLCVTTIACGEKSTAPPPVASVNVQASAVTLEVGDSFTLTAVARDAAGATLAGRPIQWQSSAPAVVSVSAASGAANATGTAVAPGAATISATSAGRTGSVVLTVVPRPSIDFGIVDAQWTQGAQQPDGAIPMVLDGNAAVLNVLMASTSPSRAPGRLVLTLRDSSNALVRTDTARPVAFSGTATYASPSGQFLVPASVLRAGLRWEVQREPAGGDPDGDATNDRWPRAGTSPLSTIALPPIHVRFVPITLTAHGSVRGDVNTGNVPAYLQTFNRIFPRGVVTTSVSTPLASSASFGTAPSGGGQAFWLQVLQDVDLARVADATARDAYWMGVIRPPNGFNNTTFGGFGYVSSSFSSTGPGTRSATVVQVGWFNNPGQTTDLVTHEIGHTLGRRHTPCGGPSGADPQYPTSDGTIGTVGHDVHAWAIGQRTLAEPKAATTGDVMSYCFPQWASPYSYLGMLLARSQSTILADSRPVTHDAPEPVLVVRGLLQDGVLTIHPAVHIRGVATSAGDGPYQLELTAGDGRTLVTQPLRLAEVDHANARTFVAAIPMRLIDTTAVSAIRVRGPVGVVTRRALRAATQQTGGPTGALPARPAATLVRVASSAALSAGRGRLTEARCDDVSASAIVVQDASTGSILATAMAARVVLHELEAHSVDISCSDGVRSRVRHRIAVPR